MKNFALIALTIIMIATFQKSMAQTDKKQPVAVLNHIAVYVADLAKSTAFYKDLFNLKEIPEPFHDGKHTWFSIGPSGNMHLIQGAKANLEHDKNEHLCFSVPSVDAFVATLNNKKIYFEDWVGKARAITLRVDGIKQVYFKDPDGHWLEVNDDHN